MVLVRKIAHFGLCRAVSCDVSAATVISIHILLRRSSYLVAIPDSTGVKMMLSDNIFKSTEVMHEHNSIAGAKPNAFRPERFAKPYLDEVSSFDVSQESIARNEKFKLQEAPTHRKNS